MKRLLLFAAACATLAGIVWLVRASRASDTRTLTHDDAPVPAAPLPPVAHEDPRLESSDPQPLPDVLIDPRVLVDKSRRSLSVISGGVIVKTYRISLGMDAVGDKRVEGDGKTPEGEFYVCTKNPQSQYHRSLGLSYPTYDDADRGLHGGIISRREHRQILEALRRFEQPPWKTGLGGEIAIHGGGSANDWTAGCIALQDPEAEELFDALPLGTPVTVTP